MLIPMGLPLSCARRRPLAVAAFAVCIFGEGFAKKAKTKSSSAAGCDFERIDGSRLTEETFRLQFRAEPPGRPVVLTGLDVGQGPRAQALVGKGGSSDGAAEVSWEREVLLQRFGHLPVESSEVVVYQHAASGSSSSSGAAKTALAQTTSLENVLGKPDSTLFLLKPVHPLMAALHEELTIPPPLRPMQLTGPTLSLGGLNSSSPSHQHQENWFKQLHGRKLWVVAESENEAAGKALKANSPCEFQSPRKLPKGVRRCLLNAGEVIYLPPQWHHGTCNLEEFNLGVGYIGALDHLPPFHLAAALGEVSKLTEAAATAPDAAGRSQALSARDRELFTPLHWAARRGHAGAVKRLLQLGADTKAEDAHGAAPIHLAAFEGHLPAVEALVGSAASSVTARTHASAQPIHLAASRGHVGIARHLLASGAQAWAKDSKGAEPLHMAAYEGHVSMVDLLLGKGATATAEASDGTFPSKLAAQRGHQAVLQRLQEGTVGSSTSAKSASKASRRSSAGRKGRSRRSSATAGEL
eukprot:TRINITY_DN43835_c0_g1_i1.p1 TRINITY_DN43835_c0_g1~~TRINITY_DN43835_c0_g1_i1.p1  ORF type:complete len:525 (+),score=117.26 TRINITY_DN43835_c0_g1_i1:41-1615(+)